MIFSQKTFVSLLGSFALSLVYVGCDFEPPMLAHGSATMSDVRAHVDAQEAANEAEQKDSENGSLPGFRELPAAGKWFAVEVMRRHAENNELDNSSILVLSRELPDADEKIALQLEIEAYKTKLETGYGNTLILFSTCTDSNGNKSCLDEDPISFHLLAKGSLFVSRRGPDNIKIDHLEIELSAKSLH